jgi:hypothetical protein
MMIPAITTPYGFDWKTSGKKQPQQNAFSAL